MQLLTTNVVDASQNTRDNAHLGRRKAWEGTDHRIIISVPPRPECRQQPGVLAILRLDASNVGRRDGGSGNS